MSEAIDLLVKKKAVEEVQDATQKVIELDAQIIKLANDVNQFAGKPLFKPLPSEVNKRLGENSKFISQINAKNKEAERLQNSLARAQARLSAAESKRARALQQTRIETAINNKQMKEEALLSSTLVSAYQKLTIRRNRAASTLKNLVASERASNRELRKAQREFDRYDAKVRKADRATRDFRRNVGNYESAFGKASLAFRSFIGVVGVYSALELGRTVFEQVKALNGLNLALEQVTETQDRFNAAQVFVSEVADESGANIFELQSAYTKFLAAAKTTNLTSQQTNNIFRQVAKASGVLGLSTEATNGAFRALEQILSKGKVQAEEIRGQLGERLPGAFQILARSMGLTTAELSKQLELGNVLSDEVLPGFAAELEKTYNLNLVRRVETLAASQTRLGNAWKEFLNNVEGGEGTISRVFTSIFETLTKAVEFLDDLNKTTEETQAIYDEGLKSEAVQKELTEIKIKSLDAGVTMQQQARLLRADYILAHDDAAQRVSLLKDEIEKLEKKETSGRQEGQKRIKELNELNKELKAEQSNLVIKSGRLEAVNKLLKPATENVKGFKEEVKESKEELDDLTPRLERVFAILRGTSGEEAEKLRREIEGIVEALNSSGDGINVGISGVDVPNPSEVSEGLLATIKDSYSQINEDARVSAEEQMEIFRNVFDTFSQYYNLDLTAFQNLLSGKENSLQDYANTAKSIAQAITDSALIRFENERVANQEKLDAILNSDRVSEEQKQAAQRKFEEEDRKLRIKQAKAQRLATLIQIGIDTAAGIAKAVAASPLTFGQPFASVVAATGAIQAAFVAAQPLPQFFRGTQDAPQGYAWTDEKGAELHTDSKGNIKDLGSNKGARVKYLESGDKIYTANQTRDILKNSVTGDTELTQMKIDRLIMRKASNITVSSDGIKKEIRSGIKQGFAGIRFPVSNDNYSRY